MVKLCSSECVCLYVWQDGWKCAGSEDYLFSWKHETACSWCGSAKDDTAPLKSLSVCIQIETVSYYCALCTCMTRLGSESCPDNRGEEWLLSLAVARSRIIRCSMHQSPKTVRGWKIRAKILKWELGISPYTTGNRQKKSSFHSH